MKTAEPYLLMPRIMWSVLSGITASPLLSLLYWFPDKTVLRAALSTGHLAYNVSPPSILSLAVEHLIVITYPFWSADNLTTSCLIPGIIMSMWFFAGLSALVLLIGLELHCSYVMVMVRTVKPDRKLTNHNTRFRLENCLPYNKYIYIYI